MKSKQIANKLLLYAWPYGIVVFFVMYFVTKSWLWPKSFAMGFLASLMLFNMMARSYAKMEKEKTIRRNLPGYLLRLCLSGVLLFIGVYDERFNVWAILIGLLTMKVIIYSYNLYKFIRKESIVKDDESTTDEPNEDSDDTESEE